MFTQMLSAPRRKAERMSCGMPKDMLRDKPREDFQHRTLFCALDIASFPAQVMGAYYSHLRGKAFVVICQDEHSHNSIVVSRSIQAAALGMDNGIPLYIVSRRWPHVAIVKRDVSLEKACCEEIAAVLYRYSPDIDVRANGASFVDLSRTPVQRTLRAFDIGTRICRDIIAAVPLNAVSAGLGATQTLARIMARHGAPKDAFCDVQRDTSFGVCVCEAGAEAQTIAHFDTTMLPGLSGQCRQKLIAYGLRHIEQLQKLSKQALVSRFGTEGEKLYSMAMGGSVSLGSPRDKSFGLPCRAETVLENDINDIGIIMNKVRYTVDKICFLLKNSNVQVTKFTLTIKYSDNKKSQKTITLPSLTNDFLTMAQYAQQAFVAQYQRRVAIKSIILDTKDVRPDPCQTSLFETSWERKQLALARQIMKVRNENSFDAVVSAAVLQKSL